MHPRRPTPGSRGFYVVAAEKESELSKSKERIAFIWEKSRIFLDQADTVGPGESAKEVRPDVVSLRRRQQVHFLRATFACDLRDY